jgi:hypothetical protein
MKRAIQWDRLRPARCEDGLPWSYRRARRLDSYLRGSLPGTVPRTARVALFFVLLVATCHWPHHPGYGAQQPDCAQVASLLNPSGRLAALISVHAHALAGGHAEAIDLARAATVLECDFLTGTAGAGSRKRRVVAELAAYGRLQEFEEPIAILQADLAAIRTLVRANYRYTDEYLLRNPAVLEMVVSNIIAEHPEAGGLLARSVSGDPPGDPAPACDRNWKQEAPFAVWNIGPAITVDGRISLDVPVKQVESNLDAQRWDECSAFWDPPPDSTQIQEKTASGAWQGKPKPPAPGSDYADWETLFEHFVCDGAPACPACRSWFDNRLQVKNTHGYLASQPTLKGYVVSYSLPKGAAIDGCVGATDPKCVGGTTVKVETDQGWLEIYNVANRTMVVTHKEVKFDNSIGNGISEAVLTYAELARELAEVACCVKAAKP